TDDVGAHGAIPLHVIQKYLNFHFSVSLDLFGSETSTNVANYFTAGLKGRWSEERRPDDHRLLDDTIAVDALMGGQIARAEVSALIGLNPDLRREYISDCQSGVNRWNRILGAGGIDRRLALPHVAFNRKVGAFSGVEASPSGQQVELGAWERRQGEW